MSATASKIDKMLKPRERFNSRCICSGTGAVIYVRADCPDALHAAIAESAALTRTTNQHQEDANG